MMKTNLPTVYQAVIAQSRYARFMPEKKRRETWEETVQRLVSYLEEKTPVLKKDISSRDERSSTSEGGRVKDSDFNSEWRKVGKTNYISNQIPPKPSIGAYY